MNSKPASTLSSHRYDPLDRLAAQTVDGATVQRFYQQGRLVTETDGTQQRSVLRVEDQPLAVNTPQQKLLLATDQPGTVLQALAAEQSNGFAYTPFGFCAANDGVQSLLGFNGERPEPVTGHYLLGNGYRAFNPISMRSNSPDSLSPFERGGMNAYAAYMNNPISYVDRDGHSILSALRGLFGAKKGLTVASSEAADLPEMFKLSRSKNSTLYQGTQTDAANLLQVITGRYKGLSQQLNKKLSYLDDSSNLLKREQAEKLRIQMRAAFGKKPLDEKGLQHQALVANNFMVDMGDINGKFALTRKSRKRIANEAKLYRELNAEQRRIRVEQPLPSLPKYRAPKGQRYQWEQE